jgi:hypothetical protein
MRFAVQVVIDQAMMLGLGAAGIAVALLAERAWKRYKRTHS